MPVSKFVELKNSSGATRFYFRHHTDNRTSFYHDGTGRLEFLNSQNGADIQFRVRYGISNTRGLDIHGTTGNILPYGDGLQDIGENTIRWRNGYFDTLYGDGSNLTGIEIGISTEALVKTNGQTASLDLTKDDHKVTATGNVTIDVTGGTEASNHTLRVVNSGIATVGFSTYFLFPSGGTPVLPTASGAISLISFTVHRAGAVGVSTQLLSGSSVNFS